MLYPFKERHQRMEAAQENCSISGTVSLFLIYDASFERNCLVVL